MTSRLHAALDMLHRSRVPINRMRRLQYGSWRRVSCRSGAGWYVGSVIVNETNFRYFEPAPRRNMSAGIQASLQF